MPAIDAPTHLQHHATVDPSSFGLTKGVNLDSSSDEDDVVSQDQNEVYLTKRPVFWLDRTILIQQYRPDTAKEQSCSEDLASDAERDSEVVEGRKRKFKDLAEEDGELFGYIAANGSLVIRILTVRTIA
jgi:hypothetical protein